MVSTMRNRLKQIKTFDSLIEYLRDELDWPIVEADLDSLTFKYEAEELGIDQRNAANIESIRQLRPLVTNQPWGIFFVEFEPTRLPVIALRRILNSLVVKKRSSDNVVERAAWQKDDLLFISNYGEGDERQINLAHFTDNQAGKGIPLLRVLGWDSRDTPFHLDDVAGALKDLAWPKDEGDTVGWRETWRSAFTLQHKEVTTTSRALATRLAVLARAIRDRITTVLAIETRDGPVTKLMMAFREALVHDLDNDMFSDMYAQTITYGLLSAKVSSSTGERVDSIPESLQIISPFLGDLMQTFLSVEVNNTIKPNEMNIDFDELGVNEVVDLLDNTNMEAVVADFGDKNPQEDPVIHFYEQFLKEYDPKLRMDRGVFYTPRSVVSFIVRSVDEKLRDEFGLEDGLADTTTWGEMAEKYRELNVPEGTSVDQPFVQILDPATGTGTFLVEVIDVVHQTMTRKWRDAGLDLQKIEKEWNSYVPKFLLPRLYGYELLTAPYAIAHLKIGLKLQETGYRFESSERVRIYLTNALEAYQPFQVSFDVPALAHEAEAVNSVKRDQRFTVIIGNPPYSNFGQQNRIPFILGLLDDYKFGLEERKLNLDDDFIKFLRFGHHCREVSGTGILGFISNNVFFDGITHRRMRESLLDSFKSATFVDLHGNARRVEKTMEGLADENVFDIMQGVAISLLAAGPKSERQCSITHLQGSRLFKYDALTGMLNGIESAKCSPTAPYYLFNNLEGSDDYSNWIPLSEVFNEFLSPIQTKRDRLTIHHSQHDLDEVLSDLRSKPELVIREKYRLAPDGRDWKLPDAIEDVKNPEGRVIKIGYKPFDNRFTYYTGKTRGFIAYPRFNIMRHLFREDAIGFVFKRQGRDDQSGYSYFFVIDNPFSEGLFAIDPRGREYLAPLYVSAQHGGQPESLPGLRSDVNFSDKFLELLSETLEDGRGRLGGLIGGYSPEEISGYIYAIWFSPNYRRVYQELLKVDFPRIPTSPSVELFEELNSLGSELISLHLMKSAMNEDDRLSTVGTGDFHVEKVSYSEETIWINRNKTLGFAGVPKEVWNFNIGGYQVCEKWLKDRQARGGKNPSPGRILTDAEIAHFEGIVFAISETIRIMQKIDSVIDDRGGWPGAFN